MSHSGANILNQAQMCVFSCCCGCSNDAGMFLSHAPLRALLLAFITLLLFTVDNKTHKVFGMSG